MLILKPLKAKFHFKNTDISRLAWFLLDQFSLDFCGDQFSIVTNGYIKNWSVKTSDLVGILCWIIKLMLIWCVRWEGKNSVGLFSRCESFLIAMVSWTAPLWGQTGYIANCRRISQQGGSVCSSFVLSFCLIAPTKFKHVYRFVSEIQEHTDTKMCAYLVHSLAS